MSDLQAVLADLRADARVRLVPPGRAILMQDELHDAGRAALASDPTAVAYLGWHWQAHAFDPAGTQVRSQYVYFGGDRAAALAAVDRLGSRGFLVRGGTVEGEAIVFAPDPGPREVTLDNPDALAQRLTNLADRPLNSVLAGPVPLRDGEEDLLHRVLASAELGELYPVALTALHLRGLLGTQDLVSPAVRSHASVEMLTAAGDAGALDLARTNALESGAPDEYLRAAADAGLDPVIVGVELADELRDRQLSVDEPDPDGDQRLTSVASAITSMLPVGYPGAILAALDDPRIPEWLAAKVARAHDGVPLSRWASAQPRFATAAPSAKAIDQARSADELADRLAAAVDVAGDPPLPGFAPGGHGLRLAAEYRERVADRHEAGLRALLTDARSDEPTLAVALQILNEAGRLLPSDLDIFRKGWKRRLWVKPGSHTPAAPAVLTFWSALAAAGDPLADTVRDTILRDKRVWSTDHRLLLRGATGSADDRAELWAIASTTNSIADGIRDATTGWALLESRLTGRAPARLLAEAIPGLPEQPGFIRRGFAQCAIAFADGAPLWSRFFDRHSMRAFAAAMGLAADESLPAAARQAILAVADGSMLVKGSLDNVPREDVSFLKRQRKELSI